MRDRGRKSKRELGTRYDYGKEAMNQSMNHYHDFTHHDPVETWSKQGLVLYVSASSRPASCLSLSLVSCSSLLLCANTHLSPKGQSFPSRIFLHISIFFLKKDLRKDLIVLAAQSRWANAVLWLMAVGWIGVGMHWHNIV